MNQHARVGIWNVTTVSSPDSVAQIGVKEKEEMTLYEVAIITKPSKKGAEEGTESETILLPPTPIVARDENSASIAAVAKANLGDKFDPNKCQVLVRPFVK